MFFSIIVPVYNVEKYLRKCLESIRKQSFDDFEVIVVDDGSTDTCPEICEEYARLDARFKVIHKANGGLVSARKAGAEHITGEYLVSIDGDDEIEEDMLEEIYRLITERHPDMLALGLTYVEENGAIIGERLNEIATGYYAGETFADFTSVMFYNKNNKGINCGSVIFSITSKVIKTSIYREIITKIDEQLKKGEDLVQFLYLMKRVRSVVVSDYCGYHYRMNLSSMMHVHHIEDLYNQALLGEIMLRETGDDAGMQLRAAVCFFALTDTRLKEQVGPDTSYREFLEIIRVAKEKHLFDCIAQMREVYPCFTFSERMKLLIIRFGWWRIFYIHLMRGMKKTVSGYC